MLLFRPDGCACVNAQTEAIEKFSRELVVAKAKCAANEKEVSPFAPSRPLTLAKKSASSITVGVSKCVESSQVKNCVTKQKNVPDQDAQVLYKHAAAAGGKTSIGQSRQRR